MRKNIHIITEAILIIAFLSVGFIRGIGCSNQNARAMNEVNRRSGFSEKRDEMIAEYIQQGDAFYNEGDWASAAMMYWKVLKQEKKPALVEPHIKLAAIYFYRNQWPEDAMVQLNTALELDPRNVEAYLLRGIIFRSVGLPEKAEQEYLRALEIEPHNAAVHYYLGAMYHARQIYDEAIYEYKLAIGYDTEMVPPPFESMPYGIQARFMLGRLYKQTGRIDEAIEELEQVVAAGETYQDVKSELVALLDLKAQSVERGGNVRDYTGALRIYERIIQLEPDYIDAWIEIGKIKAYWLNNPKEGLKAFQKAYEIDPTHFDVILHLKGLQQELKLE